jgi:type II secretory pathway pseudopilin PulG
MPFLMLAGAWWKAGVGIVLGILIALPIGQFIGARHARQQEQAARAVAIADALQRQAAITEKTYAQRLADAQRIAAARQELTDAVADLPDENPTPRDVLFACQQLRQQGTDVSNLPECQRTPGAPQAPPGPTGAVK